MSGTRCVVPLMAAALALCACGKGPSDAEPPGPVETVSITPAAPSVGTGATLQLQALLKDAHGNTLTDRVVTWSTSDTTVARVSSTGVLTGKGVGQTTVTAASEGKSGTAAASVTLGPPQLDLDPAYGVSADSATFWGYVEGWGAQYEMNFQVARNASFSPYDSAVWTPYGTSSGWMWTYSNLTGNTTYYFRMVARNSAGTTISPARSFTTLPAGAPLVTALRGDSIGPGNVRYMVDVGANGASTRLTYQDGENATAFGDIGGCDTIPIGLYSRYTSWCKVYGYRGSTTYWYRVQAGNAAGTTTSNVGSFTTLPAAAPALTSTATDSLTSTMVIVWGWVIPNGAEPTVSFQWGTSSSSLATLDPCTQDTATIKLLPKWVGCRIPGLTPGTQYYWRVTATNTAGTTVGAVKPLVTLASSSVASGVVPNATRAPTVAPAGGPAPAGVTARGGSATRGGGAAARAVGPAGPQPAPKPRQR